MGRWLLYVAEHLVDSGAGHVVDDEDDESDEEEQEEETEDVPLVVVPDDVLEGFPGGHEPEEGSSWTTVHKEREEME